MEDFQDFLKCENSPPSRILSCFTLLVVINQLTIEIYATRRGSTNLLSIQDELWSGSIFTLPSNHLNRFNLSSAVALKYSIKSTLLLRRLFIFEVSFSFLFGKGRVDLQWKISRFTGIKNAHGEEMKETSFLEQAHIAWRN